MMTCRQLVELLIDFVSGELPEADRALVKKHLDDCPPCLVYLETYQLTIRVSRQLPPHPLPASLLEQLAACLREMQGGEPPKGCGPEGGARP
jgi:anti-sigma factor RsiW